MASSNTDANSPISSTSTSNIAYVSPFRIFLGPIHFKLDDDNFSIWKQQVLATINSLNLISFLEPPVASSLSDKPSAAYYQQDQAIVAWLLSSMSLSVLSKMVDFKTSYEIWHNLMVYHSSQTRSQVNKLKIQLRTPKRDRTVARYLLDLKKTVDALVALGCPISSQDHIEAILDGLSHDYHFFITSIISRLDSYTVEDLENLLLTQEEEEQKIRHSTKHLIQIQNTYIFYISYSRFRFLPSAYHPLSPLLFITSFGAIYLLILDSTNRRTNILTVLLVPYIFFSFPDLFYFLRGEIGEWVTFVAFLLRVLFSGRFPDWLEIPGSMILILALVPEVYTQKLRNNWVGLPIDLFIGSYLLQEHIRASGGFRNSFTWKHGISNTLAILLLIVYPICAFIIP